jgi:hypothetical protein
MAKQLDSAAMSFSAYTIISLASPTCGINPTETRFGRCVVLFVTDFFIS